MESSTLENIYKQKKGDTDKMPNVLISTIYSAPDPIMLIITKLGIDKLILVIDEDPDEKQKSSYNLINKALGNVIEVKLIKTKVYDLVKVAEDVTKAIDLLSDKELIYVNITGARKTQALGLLFGSYTRIKKVKQIVYVIEDENKLIYLPKLSFDLNNSQREVLEIIKKNKIKTHTEMADKVEISRGMLYRTITELVNLGLVIHSDEDGFKLTDAGKISIL